MTEREARCAAAHPYDSAPCEGHRQAVKVIFLNGDEVTGCVNHAARLYASLHMPRVHPVNDEHGTAALTVYYRALHLDPCPWLGPRQHRA